jgi:Raf kinase inhibitor-like YbhB/YbcL family protein
MADFILKCSLFKEDGMIPPRYTCDGENINPLLEIRGVPKETKSLVLIMDDPDATNGKVWDHWILWNINPKTQYISEDSLPLDAVVGTNSWGSARYGGPCPPHGADAHRYMFKLYALDTILDVLPTISKGELERTIEPHVIARTDLMGKYGR